MKKLPSDFGAAPSTGSSGGGAKPTRPAFGATGTSRNPWQGLAMTEPRRLGSIQQDLGRVQEVPMTPQRQQMAIQDANRMKYLDSMIKSGNADFDPIEATSIQRGRMVRTLMDYLHGK